MRSMNTSEVIISRDLVLRVDLTEGDCDVTGLRRLVLHEAESVQYFLTFTHGGWILDLVFWVACGIYTSISQLTI